MKFNFLRTLGFSFLVLHGVQSMAVFNSDEMQTATQSAIFELKKTEPGHFPHITGFKTWASAEDAKVKLYISHDGMTMEFNYLCNKHPGTIDCHIQ